jgi:hypothetical protein
MFSFDFSVGNIVTDGTITYVMIEIDEYDFVLLRSVGLDFSCRMSASSVMRLMTVLVRAPLLVGQSDVS